MDKQKKYSIASKNDHNQAEEPLMAYSGNTEPLTFLATLDPSEIYHKRVSGGVLAEIQSETSLNAQILADVLGIGKSKYYDLIKIKDLGDRNIDALADFANLWQKGLEAFDDDKDLLNQWLNTRNENLGGVLPVELLGSRLGRRELEKAFMRIEHSVYG